MPEPRVVYQAVMLEELQLGVFGEEHIDEETIGIYTRKGYGIDAINRYKKIRVEDGGSLDGVTFNVRTVELDKDLIYSQTS